MIYLKLNAKKYLNKKWRGVFIEEEPLLQYILCLQDKEENKKELEEAPNYYFYAGKWHKIKKIIIISRYVWNENWSAGSKEEMYLLKKEKIIRKIDEDGEI